MISEFALFIFTSLGGLAAGAYAVGAVFPAQKEGGKPWVLPVLALIMLAIGGVALLMHLGQPMRVLNAFANPAAGITQEGIATVLFGVFVVIDLAFAVAKSGSPRWVKVVAGVLGLVLAFVMGNAYFMMDGTPAWASWQTIPLFLVGDLAVGAALMGALGSGEGKPTFWTASAVLQALFAVSAALEAAHFASVGESVVPFVVAAVLALVAAVAAWAAKSKGTAALAWAVFAASAVAVLVARYAFYMASVI